MHHFKYHNNVLHVEDVDIINIAKDIGTPFYCYSTATLERHYSVLMKAFSNQNSLICYAVKANSNQAVLATIARLGAGMDVVSVGELRRARAVGVPADKIIFAGVGKTRDEMTYALREHILGFNVESTEELEALSSVAVELGEIARVAIRVNPDVDARTHAKISTGKSNDKFGVPFSSALSIYNEAGRLPGIIVNGIHMHIGSQITSLAPFREAFNLMGQLTKNLRHAGHKIQHLDIGGGLGVPYLKNGDLPPSPEDYAAIVRQTIGDLGVKVILEPGRMIAANAGVLVTRVIFVKRTETKLFTVVDAAMNDLIRPTLYDADHEIWPVSESLSTNVNVLQDVVGPICETGDYLAQNRYLPVFRSGDLMAVLTAGAYGAVMASTYNSRLMIPEILVKENMFAVVRPRPTYDHLIGLDCLPSWLS
ncbi:MAG: diaminopimelate decarboxylase [Hyphomicrobiaceae bacterium]|nr:diaminopimelate decarboxylase [Hyphomicrobiaceae bacterium]